MVSQNIGNGTGMLYATDLAATKIISCTRNDKEGVRNMRTLGAGSAPIAAKRSAVATVTFTAIGGAGNVTAITIAGVNQIPSNVAATVGDPTQTATDVAAAINGYTPGSGTDFVANSVGAVLYIYSTPSAGQATNGLVVTVSVSNVAITFTKTDFAGGSSESGNTDSSIGLRFWLDPKGNAPRTSFASAEEITKYIVVRGLQTGIVTKTLAVNTGRLTGIDRSCAITQIFTDTQSSAATDDLDFIETVDFVEGDVIRLTQYVSGRVVTVTDASTSAGNIYLTNQSPFNCEDNKSIELRLQFDSTLGLIWIENGRSVSTGYITLSRVEARALASTGAIIIGQTYNVYDVGDDGIVLTGITANLYSFDGEYIAVLPDYQNNSGDFDGTWNGGLGSVTIGKLYAYNGAMWESVTGSVGSAPNTDAVNWLLIDKTDPRYVREIDFVQYDIDSNQVVRRTDKRSNLIVGSTSITAFKWGDDNFSGNTIINTSNNWMVNCIGSVAGSYISCGSFSCDTSAVIMTNCNFVGNTVTVVNIGSGISMYGWNVKNKLPINLDFSILYNTNNFENVVNITDTYSDLVAITPSISGTTLTLTSAYNYVGTLVVNQTGANLVKLLTDTGCQIPFKTFKVVTYANTTLDVTFTAKASAVAGHLLSTAATTITLTNISNVGDATVCDFIEITYPLNIGAGDITWNTINSKVYA